MLCACPVFLCLIALKWCLSVSGVSAHSPLNQTKRKQRTPRGQRSPDQPHPHPHPHAHASIRTHPCRHPHHGRARGGWCARPTTTHTSRPSRPRGSVAWTVFRRHPHHQRYGQQQQQQNTIISNRERRGEEWEGREEEREREREEGRRIVATAVIIGSARANRSAARIRAHSIPLPFSRRAARPRADHAHTDECDVAGRGPMRCGCSCSYVCGVDGVRGGRAAPARGCVMSSTERGGAAAADHANPTAAAAASLSLLQQQPAAPQMVQQPQPQTVQQVQVQSPIAQVQVQAPTPSLPPQQSPVAGAVAPHASYPYASYPSPVSPYSMYGGAAGYGAGSPGSAFVPAGYSHAPSAFAPPAYPSAYSPSAYSPAAYPHMQAAAMQQAQMMQAANYPYQQYQAQQAHAAMYGMYGGHAAAAAAAAGGMAPPAPQWHGGMGMGGAYPSPYPSAVDPALASMMHAGMDPNAAAAALYHGAAAYPGVQMHHHPTALMGAVVNAHAHPASMRTGNASCTTTQTTRTAWATKSKLRPALISSDALLPGPVCALQAINARRPRMIICCCFARRVRPSVAARAVERRAKRRRATRDDAERR